nr:MAG TPA: hypothetical protein [Caudoviricetes sp.]
MVSAIFYRSFILTSFLFFNGYTLCFNSKLSFASKNTFLVPG